ncbi:hypothetical protein LTR66_001961 [Elasticomyces elasticus]|nr:hypothetical protein LTR66_001961 [Elasticomyces elasticus]
MSARSGVGSPILTAEDQTRVTQIEFARLLEVRTKDSTPEVRHKKVDRTGLRSKTNTGALQYQAGAGPPTLVSQCGPDPSGTDDADSVFASLDRELVDGTSSSAQNQATELQVTLNRSSLASGPLKS